MNDKHINTYISEENNLQVFYKSFQMKCAEGSVQWGPQCRNGLICLEMYQCSCIC